jgi:hypothetical protein
MEDGPRGAWCADEGERPEKVARSMKPAQDIDERYARKPAPEKGFDNTTGRSIAG